MKNWIVGLCFGERTPAIRCDVVNGLIYIWEMVGPFPAAWSWAEIGIFLPAEMTLDSILRKMRPIKLICKIVWEAFDCFPFIFGQCIRQLWDN